MDCHMDRVVALVDHGSDVMHVVDSARKDASHRLGGHHVAHRDVFGRQRLREGVTGCKSRCHGLRGYNVDCRDVRRIDVAHCRLSNKIRGRHHVTHCGDRSINDVRGGHHVTEGGNLAVNNVRGWHDVADC